MPGGMGCDGKPPFQDLQGLRPSAGPAARPSSRPAPAMDEGRTSACGVLGAWPGQTFRSVGAADADDRAWPLGHCWRTGIVVGSCCPAAGGECVVVSGPASYSPDAYPPVSRALRR